MIFQHGGSLCMLEAKVTCELNEICCYFACLLLLSWCHHIVVLFHHFIVAFHQIMLLFHQIIVLCHTIFVLCNCHDWLGVWVRFGFLSIHVCTFASSQ